MKNINDILNNIKSIQNSWNKKFDIKSIEISKDEIKKQSQIIDIQNRLDSLDLDFQRYNIGFDVPNINDKVNEFIKLYKQICLLKNKTPDAFISFISHGYADTQATNVPEPQQPTEQ